MDFHPDMYVSSSVTPMCSVVTDSCLSLCLVTFVCVCAQLHVNILSCAHLGLIQLNSLFNVYWRDFYCVGISRFSQCACLPSSALSFTASHLQSAVGHMIKQLVTCPNCTGHMLLLICFVSTLKPMTYIVHSQGHMP